MLKWVVGFDMKLSRPKIRLILENKCNSQHFYVGLWQLKETFRFHIFWISPGSYYSNIGFFD